MDGEDLSLDADVDSFKRCGTSNTFDVEYRVLKDLILHRSSINNNASLSNKFGGFYFSFKFGISGLLLHMVTTLADKIRELLEYMDVHDNDASESSQLSWRKIVYVGEVGYSTSLSMVCVKYSAYVRRIVADFLHVTLNEYSPRPNDKLQYYIKVSESAQDRDVGLGEADSETLPKRKQVKTMKIQVGVQVSRPKELKRHLQLWKCFGRLDFVLIVLVRNI
ncbi:hypothetical protein Tco_0866281, partial [Tanacetum coccineum]